MTADGTSRISPLAGRPTAGRLSLTMLFLLALLATAAPGPGADEAESCWPGEPGSDPTLCRPDDPGYERRWEFGSRVPPEIDVSKMHPAERALGSIGMSLDSAWQLTTGRDDVLIAVLDSGIRWETADLVRKLHINPGELPPPEGSTVHDANGDGKFDIDDYATDARVGDRNGNGILDPGDLIRVFSDCVDDDGNGYADDISGYDFFSRDGHCGFAAGDNDPSDDTDFGHGTGIASTAAAETNNGVRDAGVCPDCRVLPVRVGDSFVVDANQFARGIVFAVHSGADVVASALGSYNNTPAARYAVDLAWNNGLAIVASAADEYSYHHNYPSVYNHTLYVNSIRSNNDDYRKASTFWGVNPCTNFGARVWVSVPSRTCSSGATSRLAGVVGLMESMALDSGREALHPEEVFQIVGRTADDLDNTVPDWGDLRFPARAGFDQYYGYGRVNALRAVTAVRDADIGPIVDLANPRWFAIVSPKRTPLLSVSGEIRLPSATRGSYRLEYALGVEPTEADYHLVGRGEFVGSKQGSLGVLNFKRLPVPQGPAPRGRSERDRYSVTVRLTARDDRGIASEARRSFFVHDDPDWKRHFPVDLGASGEAGPQLVDLNGDGRDEIILPTADGFLRIIEWQASGLRTIRAPLDPVPLIDPHPGASRGKQQALSRETAIRGAAVGDLFGDGRLTIVVASREGKVYAFSSRGERRGAFPVAIEHDNGRPATEQQQIETGILSRPVLADLDGKPGLEIIVSALDGHVYVWRNDGTLLDGFPVAVQHSNASMAGRSKIVSTPAVGDLDGDGSPEIVVGSNGEWDDLSGAYAIRARGNTHPAGAFLPGWQPFGISALRASLLPTLSSGIPMEPVLVDVDHDGDLEALLYAVTGSEVHVVDQTPTGPRTVARLGMRPTGDSEFRLITFLAGTGSPLLADTDRDGTPEFYAPLLSFRMLSLRSNPGIPLDVPLGLGGWKLDGLPNDGSVVPMLPSFPRRMEDLMVFARPAAADVDGDGELEVLMGSGGYLVHGFKPSGGEALGFPRFTGGWTFSAPAVGDLDGNGRADVVSVTREGYLFAWE